MMGQGAYMMNISVMVGKEYFLTQNVKNWRTFSWKKVFEGLFVLQRSSKCVIW